MRWREPFVRLASDAHRKAFVGLPAAVLVHAVANLAGTRVDGRVAVLAIVARDRAAVARNGRLGASCALQNRHGLVAVLVAVIVAAFVGRALARVVDAVANFNDVLVDLHAHHPVELGVAHVGTLLAHVRVVAVARRYLAARNFRPLVVGHPVAVVVVAIAGFDVAMGLADALRPHLVARARPLALLALVRVRAVARQADREVAAISILPVVRDAVAVVVHVVAQLGRTDRRERLRGALARTALAHVLPFGLARRTLGDPTVAIEVRADAAVALGDRSIRRLALVDRVAIAVIARVAQRAGLPRAVEVRRRIVRRRALVDVHHDGALHGLHLADQGDAARALCAARGISNPRARLVCARVVLSQRQLVDRVALRRFGR